MVEVIYKEYNLEVRKKLRIRVKDLTLRDAAFYLTIITPPIISSILVPNVANIFISAIPFLLWPITAIFWIPSWKKYFKPNFFLKIEKTRRKILMSLLKKKNFNSKKNLEFLIKELEIQRTKHMFLNTGIGGAIIFLMGPWYFSLMEGYSSTEQLLIALMFIISLTFIVLIGRSYKEGKSPTRSLLKSDLIKIRFKMKSKLKSKK